MTTLTALPPWARERCYLSAPQVALILGYVGSNGAFDDDAAKKYVRHHGARDLKRMMKLDSTFPRPSYPHGEGTRAFWLAAELNAWILARTGSGGHASTKGGAILPPPLPASSLEQEQA